MTGRPGASVTAVLLTAGLVLLGCTEPDPNPEQPAKSGPTREPDPTGTPSGAPSARPDASTSPAPGGSAVFDAAAAKRTVARLAGGFGPREATSPSFRRAARWVQRRLETWGYETRRMPVRVPSGTSWGVPVDAGRSVNLIADPPGLAPGEPYLIIGAHLDTVPQAPGAEDNASGVAVMLELARLARTNPARLPVRFVAFGAEEPRGDGDDLHHFGSQEYVRTMRPAARRNLRAMVALDRVGVRGDFVPVCTGGTGGGGVRDDLVEAGGRVPTRTCEDRASDHWSFEKAGLPAARIGSIPYAGYHSPDDRPSVVDPRQLRRVGRLMWRWMRTR